MSSSPIRVGFVGLSSTGWAANALGPSLFQPSLQDKYSLVAVSTTSEASAKASADKYAEQAGRTLKAYHGNSSAIANDPDVDLVAVAVKSYLQKDVVLPVIEAKKPYFLEWPAGKSTSETEEIATASKAHGVRNIIGLQGRGSPVIRKVKEILASGVIGKVVSTELIATCPREIQFWGPEVKQSNAYINVKANGAGFLTVSGLLLDAFTFTLGHFENVSAFAKTQYPNISILDDEGKPTGRTRTAELPDHYSITGQLTSGAFATFVLQAAHKMTPGRIGLLWQIDGEEGSIRLESSYMFLNVRNPALYLNGEKVEVEGTESEVIGILANAWEQFALGDEGTHATIDDALALHRLLDAIELSVEQNGKVVQLSS